LLDRERELGLLEAAIETAASGRSALVMIEGAAGIGKTQLLRAAQSHASAAGLLPLTARGGELEREFAFGVVRQLFEGHLVDARSRERALAGPAAVAQPIFGTPERRDDQWTAGEGAPSFALLHGVYWLVVNISGERPLMIALDDLQWCDRPSLRCWPTSCTGWRECPS
jgi:hypothetical protein